MSAEQKEEATPPIDREMPEYVVNALQQLKGFYADGHAEPSSLTRSLFYLADQLSTHRDFVEAFTKEIAELKALNDSRDKEEASFANVINSLDDQLSDAQKDSRRLDWMIDYMKRFGDIELSDHSNVASGPVSVSIWNEGVMHTCSRESFREAIDAMMDATKGGE